MKRDMVDPTSKTQRLTTGNAQLDRLLGGGLLPGTLTVVMGATGIGKTQLGLQFAHQGLHEEGQRGIVCDLTSRGDCQNHHAYARRLCDWELRDFDIEAPCDPPRVFEHQARSDYVHLFRRSGRRVTIHDLEIDEWKEWKIELNRKLNQAIAFFYGNFAHGVRRCVIDGVEPAERASDSFQFHVFNYVYHQILRKDAEWLARDLFRVKYREHADRVAEHAYRHEDIACLLLYTTHEILLDDLLVRPLESGDELANANTIILMGKVRDGIRMRRALHVAKHRGSPCEDAIVPFEVCEDGLVLKPEP